ncbi:hypothetical protein PINS_up000468 [Pythium insidiosum]|nr:hypothetical protein PINS_up000468 [Pythium insidiosum]
MQRNADCSLCQRPRRAFFCARCTSDLLQQRRTMLAALQADVAVLRKKTEFALNSKSGLVDAERRLSACMDKVEVMAQRVMKTRERLCSERIELVERASAVEKRSEMVERAHARLQKQQATAHNLHVPVLQCLDIQVAWTKDTAARVRGNTIRDLFTLFGLRADADGPTTPKSKFFRSIASLPLPISGRYEIVPPEVVAAALGKVIHLLTIVAKYVQLSFPHPMVLNGSFSTIGNTSEGAGCHTLYPDGSVGFDRGVAMLHENILHLASSQGVDVSSLHRTDILGNLLQISSAPTLGTIVDTSSNSDTASAARSRQSTKTRSQQSAFLLENSQTLDASAEILPEYSMVQ